MSITYEDALATLQSMFADPWNRDSLDYVLRNQKGHMENTVDLILRHGDKDPQILIDQLEAGINPSQTAVAADEALARQLSQQQQQQQAPSVSPPSRATGGKGKPTTLPEDFLRVPGIAPGGSTVVDDEALARMLQDQLFSEELSRNREFAHLARGRSSARRSSSGRASGASAAAAGVVNPLAAAGSKINEFASKFAQSQRSSSNRNVQQSPNVMEKLSEMGDNAKRRLQLLAAQFNANRDNNSATGAAHTSQGQQQEFRGLLDEDDDNDNMELAARKDL